VEGGGWRLPPSLEVGRKEVRNDQKKGWTAAAGGGHGVERRRRKEGRESNLSLLGANEV